MSSKRPFILYQWLSVILISSVLYAEVSKTTIEAQIIDKIAASLFPGQNITAWGETAEQKNIIQQSKKIEAVSSSSDAHLIIVSKKIPENISKSTIILTTEYTLLTKDERVIGAFFWQKGRPNLLFVRERMQKANISLGHEFDKYIEDEL